MVPLTFDSSAALVSGSAQRADAKVSLPFEKNKRLATSPVCGAPIRCLCV